MYVSSDATLERVGGKFFQPYWSKRCGRSRVRCRGVAALTDTCSREVRSSDASYDEYVAAQLWAESAKLVDLERRLGTHVHTHCRWALTLCGAGKDKWETVRPPAVRAQIRRSFFTLCARSTDARRCSALMCLAAGVLAATAVAVAAVMAGLLVFRLL